MLRAGDLIRIFGSQACVYTEVRPRSLYFLLALYSLCFESTCVRCRSWPFDQFHTTECQGLGTGERAQQLRVNSAFVEDLVYIPSIHKVWSTLNRSSSSRRLTPPSGFRGNFSFICILFPQPRPPPPRCRHPYT